MLKRFSIVGDMRGKGLPLGVEFVVDQVTEQPFPPKVGGTRRIVTHALEEGVMVVAGRAVWLTVSEGITFRSAPYIFSGANVEQLVKTLEVAIQTVLVEIEAA